MGSTPLVKHRIRIARQAIFVAHLRMLNLSQLAPKLPRSWTAAELARDVFEPMNCRRLLKRKRSDLLSKAEVAYVLGLTLARVSCLCRAGRLGTQVGRTWVVRAGELADFILEREPDFMEAVLSDERKRGSIVAVSDRQKRKRGRKRT
jgi:hypothetical protein